MYDMLLITGVYICTLIGAGFASGRELVEFFIGTGSCGIYGIVLAVTFFMLVQYIILNVIHKFRIDNSKELIGTIFPHKYSRFFDIIVLMAMISIYVVMISGTGTILNQQLGIDRICGILIFTIICFCVFIFGDEALICSMNFIAPIVIMGILFTSLYSINGYVGAFADRNVKEYVINPILYVGYNIITLIGVMPSLKKHIKSKGIIMGSCVISGFVLGVLSILISTCIIFFRAQSKEIPMLYVANNNGKIFSIIYFVVLICAMFTTAVSNGYGSVNMVVSIFRTRSRVKSVIVFSFLSISLALLPFSILIKYLYGFLGYAGIIELIFIIAFPFKIKERSHIKWGVLFGRKKY